MVGQDSNGLEPPSDEKVNEIDNLKPMCRDEIEVRWIHSKYATVADKLALNQTLAIHGFVPEKRNNYVEPWMILVA